VNSGSSGWEYRWLTFDGPCAEMFAWALGLPKEPFQAGDCPSALFESLADALGDASRDGELAAGAATYRALSLAAAAPCLPDREKPRTPLTDALTAVEASLADPELNVQELAREMGISRFELHRRFREELGLCPKQYLDNVRLHKAMSLLRETDWTVQEVTAAVGIRECRLLLQVLPAQDRLLTVRVPLLPPYAAGFARK